MCHVIFQTASIMNQPPLPPPFVVPPVRLQAMSALPPLHDSVQLPLPHPEAYADEPREYARALMQRKDDIEKEIVRYSTSWMQLTSGRA